MNANNNILKFETLVANNFQSLGLLKGEQIVQCLDESTKGMYYPGWAVTSEGRVWSINRNRWLIPHYQNGYWRVGNCYVHLLVDHYFCDNAEKGIKKMYLLLNSMRGESEKFHLSVHHIKPILKIGCAVMTPQEKIDACMAVNKKKNLILQIEELDHLDNHRLMRGLKTQGMKQNAETWDKALQAMVIPYVTEAYVTYSQECKKEYNIVAALPTISKEDEASEKYINATNSFLLW